MPHATLLGLIRQHVHDVFSKRCTDSPDEVCETILIRDGFYCGRRFSLGRLRAVWFLEEQVVKFYGEDGEFSSVSHVDQLIRTGRAAA